MTREEAIKELSYIADEMPSMECADWKEAISMAIKALAQEPRWIPCSEKLPEEDGLYLVSVKNDHLRRYSKTCWYSYKNWFARQDVVAWQPLPEPYKGGQEDGKA